MLNASVYVHVYVSVVYTHYCSHIYIYLFSYRSVCDYFSIVCTCNILLNKQKKWWLLQYIADVKSFIVLNCVN